LNLSKTRTRARAHALRDGAAGELLQTVRSQLDVDEEGAAEVERLVALVEGAIARTQAADKGERAPMGCKGRVVLWTRGCPDP
jgi:hypothetical protein